MQEQPKLAEIAWCPSNVSRQNIRHNKIYYINGIWHIVTNFHIISDVRTLENVDDHDNSESWNLWAQFTFQADLTSGTCS